MRGYTPGPWSQSEPSMSGSHEHYCHHGPDLVRKRPQEPQISDVRSRRALLQRTLSSVRSDLPFRLGQPQGQECPSFHTSRRSPSPGCLKFKQDESLSQHLGGNEAAGSLGTAQHDPGDSQRGGPAVGDGHRRVPGGLEDSTCPLLRG